MENGRVDGLLHYRISSHLVRLEIIVAPLWLVSLG